MGLKFNIFSHVLNKYANQATSILIVLNILVLLITACHFYIWRSLQRRKSGT